MWTTAGDLRNLKPLEPSAPAAELAETPPRRDVAVNLESGRHRFNLGVVVQHLLAHLASPAGLLVTAEGERCVEDVMAIDPHRAGAQPLGHLVRQAAVACPHASSEAIDRVVGLLGDAVEIAVI